MEKKKREEYYCSTTQKETVVAGVRDFAAIILKCTYVVNRGCTVSVPSSVGTPKRICRNYLWIHYYVLCIAS